MLYWPQVHWLKLMAVMVGSINQVRFFSATQWCTLIFLVWTSQSFPETVKMLCELLTDEPEGGSSPVPLWLIRECFKYLSELDCSQEQTFFDGKKVMWVSKSMKMMKFSHGSVNSAEGVLEDETKMPNIPKKLSSSSFKNAVIDYWKYRIENTEKVSEMAVKILLRVEIGLKVKIQETPDMNRSFREPISWCKYSRNL